MSKLTFLQLAEKVLREAQEPLTQMEMWEIAQKNGWDKLVLSQGKTPWNTFSAQLYSDLKRVDSLFEAVETRPKKFIIKGMQHDTVIAALHEEIYVFLQEMREKKPDLYFALRDRDTQGRLEKGYWFWGNNDYLRLIFWKGRDKKNGDRYIQITIMKDGSTSLRLSAVDDEKKAKIFNTIAGILPNMKQLKWAGEDVAIWEKKYEGNDYLANIQYFIEKEKNTIDNILSIAPSEIIDTISPINEEEFDKSIVLIETYRSKKNEPEPELETPILASTRLYLEKLSIENIGIFSHLAFDFSERVTVLIGENGIGKTTILRAIALALAGVNENSLLDAYHPKIQQLLRIESESQKNANYSSKGNIHLSYYDAQKKYQNTIEFRSNNYGVTIEDDPNSDFASVDNDKFPHLIIGFSQALTTDTPLTVKQIPYEKLAAIKSAHIKDLLPLLYNQPDKRFEAFADWIINLYNLGNQLLIENRELKSVKEHLLIHFTFDIISDIIGTKIAFKSVKLAQGKEAQSWVWIHDSARQQDIPLHLISQGFNSVFGWVGYFMMRLYESSPYMSVEDLVDVHYFKNKEDAIVLIDEIDTYLHPKWQRNVLKVLVNKFPNTQFVVTTHSPLVATHLDGEAKVYAITQDKATEIQIAGRDISSALWDYFGVERREMTYQGAIDDLFVLLEEEPLDVEKTQKILSALKTKLGAQDPDIQRAENIFEGLLWLEKEG